MEFVVALVLAFEFPAISRLEEVPAWVGEQEAESESIALRSAKDPPFLKEPATQRRKKGK